MAVRMTISIADRILLDIDGGDYILVGIVVKIMELV
jgi:hypothetical protein